VWPFHQRVLTAYASSTSLLTVARQRLYLIILFVPTCLCSGSQNWVQHRKTVCCMHVFVKLRSAKVHYFKCVSEIQLSKDLRSVLTRVLKRRRACSRFFGPQGRSVSELAVFEPVSKTATKNRKFEIDFALACALFGYDITLSPI